MQPISFTRVKEDEVIFHYSYKQLKDFITHGKEFGIGGLLTKIRKDFFVYRCYVIGSEKTTLPIVPTLITFSVQHDPIFDGGEFSLEEELKRLNLNNKKQ
jgi:hypothetical protein